MSKEKTPFVKDVYECSCCGKEATLQCNNCLSLGIANYYCIKCCEHTTKGLYCRTCGQKLSNIPNRFVGSFTAQRKFTGNPKEKKVFVEQKTQGKNEKDERLDLDA